MKCTVEEGTTGSGVRFGRGRRSEFSKAATLSRCSFCPEARSAAKMPRTSPRPTSFLQLTLEKSSSYSTTHSSLLLVRKLLPLFLVSISYPLTAVSWLCTRSGSCATVAVAPGKLLLPYLAISPHPSAWAISQPENVHHLCWKTSPPHCSYVRLSSKKFHLKRQGSVARSYRQDPRSQADSDLHNVPNAHAAFASDSIRPTNTLARQE